MQHTDRFGNIQLAVFASELDGLFEPGRLAEVVTPDDRYYVRCAETFTDVDPGELVLYADSSGLLSVAVNRGSAAELTAAEAGDKIGVEFRPAGTGELLDPALGVCWNPRSNGLRGAVAPSRRPFVLRADRIPAAAR